MILAKNVLKISWIRVGYRYKSISSFSENARTACHFLLVINLSYKHYLFDTQLPMCFCAGVSLDRHSFTPDKGARCSSVVRAFAHGAMGRRIDPSWGGPVELFLVPASAPRLV